MNREEYRAALKERLAAFERVNAWERENPHRPPPAVAIACVADIYRLIPPERRHRQFDEKRHLEFRRALQAIDSLSK